jgi:hypothetical protein
MTKQFPSSIGGLRIQAFGGNSELGKLKQKRKVNWKYFYVN